MSCFYDYNERAYMADRIIDHLFLLTQGVQPEDYHSWKFSNNRRLEQVEDLSEDCEATAAELLSPLRRKPLSC